jgi:hypothetical protein
MPKKVYDFRGKQSNISRLTRFDPEAFVHMLFYRVLIPVSIIYGIVLLASLVFSGLELAVKALTVIIWILFTPQVFETAKAVSVTGSRGMAFGHLNESYLFILRTRYSKKAGAYTLFPYLVLALWVVGFISMVAWWSI